MNHKKELLRSLWVGLLGVSWDLVCKVMSTLIGVISNYKYP